MTTPVRKIIWAAAGVALLALAGCGSSDTKTESAASETSAAVAAAEAPKDTTFTVTDGPDGQDVVARFEIGDGYTENLMLKKSRLATMDILNYAKVEYPNAAKVTVKGGLGDTVLITATYSKATLGMFDDFKSVSSDEIWKIADSAYIDPALNP